MREAGWLVVVAAGTAAACAVQEESWETDEWGEVRRALTGSNPGYLMNDFGDQYSNRCAVDPETDIATGLDANPAYILAYRSGKSSWGVPAPYDCDFADPLCPPDPDAPVWAAKLIHRQSIQRLNRGGMNYLLVSGSVRSGVYPGFEIVEMGGHTTSGYDLGSGGVTPTTWPNSTDAIAHYFEYSSTVRRHAGGMQVSGRYVVAPFEDPSDGVAASFRTVDLANPEVPVSGPTKLREAGDLKNGGAAALTRTDDGKFLVMLFGLGAQDVEVFASTGTTMPTSPSQWDQKNAWATSFTDSYENVQLVTRCVSGGTNGDPAPLFAVATFKDTAGNDRAHVYSVTLNATTYAPTFHYETGRILTCSSANTGNTRYCDFSAGAGVYVDPAGRLILYGVEHYNDAYPNTGYGVKVREFPE